MRIFHKVIYKAGPLLYSPRLPCEGRSDNWERIPSFVTNAKTLGGVAEWSKAAVLKTAVGQPTVGSNPTLRTLYPFPRMGIGEVTERPMVLAC